MISPNKTTSFFMLLVLSSIVNAEQSLLLTLQSAIDIAVQDNPSLAQIQARSEAMAAIPPQVGSLPDPVISFNALNLPVDTFDTRQENMTQMQGGISQAIPFFGKLALREQAATYQAEAATHDVTEARFRLLRDVKKIWCCLLYTSDAADE